MTTATVGPAGAATPETAPVINPEAASAATPNDGLTDRDGLRALAWWRFEPTVGGIVYFDAYRGSLVAASVPVVAVYDAAMVQVVADAYAAQVSVVAGATYYVAVGTFDPGPATYQLLTSNIAGQGEWVQDPDVTAVWSGGAGFVTATSPAYDIGLALGHVGFHGWFGIQGVLGSSDPGRMGVDPPHGTAAGKMETAAQQAFRQAKAYLSRQSVFWGWGPGGATPDAPHIPVPVVSTDGSGLVGYTARANGEAPTFVGAFPGTYRFDVYAAGVHVKVRGLEALGGASGVPSPGQPFTSDDSTAQAYLAAHAAPGASLEYEGDGNAVTREVKYMLDEQNGGAYSLDGETQRDADLFGANGYDMDYRYWPEWRDEFVQNLDPHGVPTDGSPDLRPPPTRWGPVSHTAAWEYREVTPGHSEWVLTKQTIDAPDSRFLGSGPRWYGTDPGGEGGVSIGSNAETWHDLTDELPDILAYEDDTSYGEGGSGGGIFVAALPPALMTGLPPQPIIPSEPPEGALDPAHPARRSDRYRGGHSIAVRTVMRPVRYRITYAPVLPEPPQLTTDPPWVRALQRTDGLDAGGPPRAVQHASLRSGIST